MARTLVIHSGGIGDLLLAGPAIEGLARSAPVELAGIPERGSLLQEAGLVEAVHSLDGIAFSSIFGAPNPRFRQFVQDFDRVVVWMKDPDGQIRNAFASAGVNRVEVYPGLPPDDYPGHTATYYCGCLSLPCPTNWRLPLTSGATEDAGLCFLHPGSGSASKNWPLEHYQGLAHALTARGLRVEWIYGPAEVEQLPTGEPPPTVRDLMALAHHISRAGLYVGNDSGITHLASVLGIPTLALFGPTNPARWRPIGPRTSIVYGQPFPNFDAVLEGARTLLKDNKP